MIKRIIFGLLTLLLLCLTTNSPPVRAYPQTQDVCYSQCAAYKFVWQGDYCWDMFQENCSMGTFDSVKKAISLAKDAADAARKGDISSFSVDTIFKAWFVCKPMIENCIAPQLASCRNTCTSDQYYYAPDLSVGSPYANFVYHGVIYDDVHKTLNFKVVNNGMGYAWDIDAEASWGHTRNRDGQVGGGGQLFREVIPELIYMGARNGPPKSAGDIVFDFLIEESNFAKYLQGFKSDADNPNVPPYWYKTIPFTPPEGELTKVFFNVDPNQMIPERSENNNTFILVIDKLPTPARFEIKDFHHQLVAGSMTDFMVDFGVKNTGEENGQATVKIYQGDYDANKSPLYESSQVVQGLNQFNFSTIIGTNPEAADYCGKTKKYTIVVWDEDGNKVDWGFSLPLYVGSVNGRVVDLFAKPVVGATVSTSTGQTATTSSNGFYHLSGITTLGPITVTATHPEYSQSASSQVNLNITGQANPCIENVLTFNKVNFTLKDQDVIFTVTVKDAFGNPVTAQVLATSQDWRFSQEIQGQGPLPGMQPGEYRFTISAPGYKTISQTVSAVPHESNLEFTLEPLNGRPTDGGLTIHQPQLLWTYDLGSEILTNITASKDGQVVIFYTVNNSTKTGKLYFVDLATGHHRSVVSTLSAQGNFQSALDTSYDGNTTALFIHTNKTPTTDKLSRLYLFNNQGSSLGTLDLNPQKSASLVEVSPDGFWVYPFQLLNKGLYQYTIHDILGQDNDSPMTYSAGSGFHFTMADTKVAGCSTGGGQCIETLQKQVLANLGNISGVSRQTDSSQDANSIAIVTDDKAYLFKGAKTWEKDVDTRGDHPHISISPGGKMVIYSANNPGEPYQSIKIFSDTNVDKTPSDSQNGRTENTVFVHASDTGFYYAATRQKQLKFYKVGDYSIDYNPQTPPPTATPPLYVHGLSYYDQGVFRDAGEIAYFQLHPNTIYLANQTVTFKLVENFGVIRIQSGTLFSLNYNFFPVLLKGQITAEFNSPTHIYAIKFDRYDLDLFAQKLALMVGGNLPPDEYFEISNVHTKWTVTNSPNQVGVKVASGQVQVISQDLNTSITANHQLTIDPDNHTRQSFYLTGPIYLIVVAVLAAISAAVLFYYRHTKLGRQIIKALHVLCRWKLRLAKTLAKYLWILLSRYLPKLCLLLFKTTGFLTKQFVALIRRLITNHSKPKPKST